MQSGPPGYTGNFLNNTIEVSLEGYYKTMKDYLDYRNAPSC